VTCKWMGRGGLRRDGAKKMRMQKTVTTLSLSHTFHAVGRSPGGLSGSPPHRARARRLAKSTVWPGEAVEGEAMSAANRAARWA